jgi:hypothetical protein
MGDNESKIAVHGGQGNIRALWVMGQFARRQFQNILAGRFAVDPAATAGVVSMPPFALVSVKRGVLVLTAAVLWPPRLRAHRGSAPTAAPREPTAVARFKVGTRRSGSLARPPETSPRNEPQKRINSRAAPTPAPNDTSSLGPHDGSGPLPFRQIPSPP